MKATTCIHFTGVLFGGTRTCDAGISYDRWAGALPCIFNNQGCGPCEKFCAPTPEQIADSAAEAMASLERFAERLKLAGPSIEQWLSAQPWSRKNRVQCVGSIPCKACGTGTLHMRIAASNGHTSGRCTTKGCIQWIQ